MSVVHLIDAVTDWARQNVCEHIKLKVPPDNADANDAGYKYEVANPAAFAMYIPTSEKLPPNIHAPLPSLCVRFVSGADDMASGSGAVDVQFCFSTWDPGTHGRDLYKPTGVDGKTFKLWTGEEADAYFKRNGDGWRDAWNFVDIALRAVESTSSIGGYIVDRSAPIKFGPLTEQEAIMDFYPQWYAWVSFALTYPIRRDLNEVKNLL